MIQDLREAPANSVVVLQSCAHNPTGCDLTKEQWIKVADVVQVGRRRVFQLRRSSCSVTVLVVRIGLNRV
jgi:aspartate aminotransferase